MGERRSPRTAVVTGSSKGIGRGIALRLAEERFNVVINYSSDDDAAQEALRSCRATNPDVILVKADVSDRQAVEALMATTIERFGSLDILINNAAVVADGPMMEMVDEDWSRVIDVSLRGTFLCSQVAAKHMQEQEEGGIILNVGARTGMRARKNGINTCAAKAGVMIMTQCMALELGPKIRVNTIIPGLVMTEETRDRFHLNDPAVIQARVADIPMGRIGSPSDVADGVMLMLSDEATFMTGQKLAIDGGQWMW